MCGRFIIDDDMNEIFERYKIDKYRTEYLTGKDIYPTDYAPVIINNGKENELKMIKWGFTIPNNKGLIINARAETIEGETSF